MVIVLRLNSIIQVLLGDIVLEFLHKITQDMKRPLLQVQQYSYLIGSSAVLTIAFQSVHLQLCMDQALVM